MQTMQIQSTDSCGICMDEANRDFMYKTCCTLLVCRKCYNQLEVESFPERSICPGCRKGFHKVGYSVDMIDNIAVPRAYCGQSLPDVQSIQEHDAHVVSCVECLKKVIRGNNWFEKQIIEKFAGIKRKLQTTEDEVYVRNQRIRELSQQNAFMAREMARQSDVINRLAEGNSTPVHSRRRLFASQENIHPTPPSAGSVSSTDLFSSTNDDDDDASESSAAQDPTAAESPETSPVASPQVPTQVPTQVTPPRSTSARTTPPQPFRRQRVARERRIAQYNL